MHYTCGLGISVFWTEGTFLHIEASFYRKKCFLYGNISDDYGSIVHENI